MLFAIISSVIIMLFPLCTDYHSFIAPSMILGGTIGAFFAQRFTVVSDLVGHKNAPKVFGFLMFGNGLGNITGRLMGGLIKDYIGSYDMAFYVTGAIGVFSVIIFMANFTIKSIYNAINENKADFSGGR